MFININNTLTQTLKCHLLLKHAKFENKQKQPKITKLNWEKNIPLITQEQIKLISPDRLQKLWSSYTANTNDINTKKFTSLILQTAKKTKIHDENKWTIPFSLGKFLFNDMKCQIERNVTIFNFNTLINNFYPPFYKEECSNPSWTLTGFVNISQDPNKIKNTLITALYATHFNRFEKRLPLPLKTLLYTYNSKLAGKHFLFNLTH
jgi:hypothetical protein